MKCATCGVEFTPRRYKPDQQYCSTGCRLTKMRERHWYATQHVRDAAEARRKKQ